MRRIVNFPSFSGFFLFEKFRNQNKTKKQRKMAKTVYHLFLYVLEKNHTTFKLLAFSKRNNLLHFTASANTYLKYLMYNVYFL